MKEQHNQLDPKKIISVISPENRSFLTRLEVFQSIDSTNSYLLAQLKNSFSQSQPGSWVCFAEEQTQGRGRQGKTWYSPYGANIYCSLTWIFPAKFAGISALSIACGLLLIQSLNKLGLYQGLSLKWPNDILFLGRKLGGILIENLASPTQNRMVIGIGLNVNLSPEANTDWISVFQALDQVVSRNLVAGIVADEFLSGIRIFEQQGLKPFLPLLLQYDYLRGKTVRVLRPQGVLEGIAQGLNEAGEFLLLDQEGKSQVFSYGEVSLRLKSD